MFSDEQIFVWDIDALREITRNPTTKNLLDASARLRRVLTDSGGPLLHKVARGRDFKPRFVLLGEKVDPKIIQTIMERPSLQAWWESPDASFGGAPTREVGLDAFLRHRIAVFQHKAITVKELINYVANVGGGVHQGVPKNKDNAKLIHSTANDFFVDGHPYPLGSLLPIVKVTVVALTPLYERLRA